jgi:hypothetical protein
MCRALLFVLLIGLLDARASDAPSGLPPALLDAGADQVTARTDVPDAVRKVGEVRLVRRGDAIVVQTLLATKVLPRVVGEIRKKEAANWPADAPGREDMERYVAALGRVADALAKARDAGGDGDRRLRLMIEFVATPDVAGLVLGSFDGEEVDGKLQPTARHTLETMVLKKTYGFRNMRLILADAFHVAEGDVGRLGALGPIAEGADRSR